MARTRVALVVAHNVVRMSLRSLLDRTPDIEIIGEAGDVGETLRLVEESAPDVLVLDIDMSGLDGVQVARRLLAAQWPIRILALSAYEDRQFILGYLTQGIAGFLVKDDAPETVVDAVRRVSRGERWLSPRAAAKVAPEKGGSP
jgi:DNA-binding NarL/FixJ family response regulator